MLAKPNVKRIDKTQKPALTIHKSDPFYNEANQEKLKEAIKQIENGEIVTKSITELKELLNG